MPSWVADYADAKGHIELRTATAKMMQNTWVKVPVDPECLAFQAGASSILDLLSWCLCDEGDSMMTPAPMYPAFPNDFKARGGVNTELVMTQESKLYVPTQSELEEAYQRCLTKGSRPRILLLCHPCNPTGVVYS